MRVLPLLVAIASLVGGCGSDGTDAPSDAGLDGLVDFSVRPDPGRVGCHGYAACMVNCFAASASATVSGCITQCNENAKSADIEALWRTMFACGQGYCLGDVDAGGYKCATEDGSALLVDRTGDAVGTCATCLNDALAAAFGIACSSMSSPDCNPMACHDADDACLDDAP